MRVPLNMAAASRGRHTFRSCRCSNRSGITSDLDQFRSVLVRDMNKAKARETTEGLMYGAQGRDPIPTKGCRYSTVSTSITG